MALSERSKPAPAVAGIATYLFGLVLVLLAERVFGTRPQWECTLLVAGGLSLVASILLRFGYRSESAERVRIEFWMGWLTLGALAAVTFALLVQHQPQWFGIRADLPTEIVERKSGLLGVLWVAGLLCSVLPLLFAQAALFPMRNAPRPESRRIRSAAIAGLTLGVVALYGALFAYSAGKVGVAADYSYFKTAKPSDSTRRIARGLKEPVRVVCLFPAISEVRREVERYLADASRGNPKLKVEFHDRLLEPKVAKEMRASQDGVVILVRGEVHQTINVGVEPKNARTVLRNLDQEFQKNLLKLSRDAKVVYLTTGHGELNERKGPEVTANGQGTQILKKLLEMQNFRLQDLGATQGLGHEVPRDADVVLVLGPTEPFSPEELATLDAHAREGGHLLLALDVDARAHGTQKTVLPEATATPRAVPLPGAQHAADNATKVAAVVSGIANREIGSNIDELAAIVGVGIQPGVLANDRIFAQRRFDKSDYTQLVTNRFSSHAAVSTLNRSNGNVVFFGAGALKKLQANDNAITFVVHTMQGTYLDTNGSYDLDGTESRASLELVAAVTRPVTGGERKGDKPDTKAKETRAIVIGDADVATDLVLMNAPANRLLLVDALRWLVGEESFSGELSSEEDVRIQHTKEKDVFWFYSTILGAPVLVLAVGLYLVRRSRSNGGQA
jgi:hypothetical protein